MPCGRIWTEWLAEHVAKEAREEEPKRFAAAVQCLKDDWEKAKGVDGYDKFDRVLHWFPRIFAFMDLKRDYPVEDVITLVQVSLEIVFDAKDDVAVLVRYGEIVSFHLKKNRKEIAGKLEIPWRPLHELATHVWDRKRLSYQGEDSLMALRDSIQELVYRCSSFFPNSSAAEIWAEFRPALLHTQGHECFEALGWLVHFMPTQSIGKDASVNWDGWFDEWLDLYERIAHCEFWDCHWLDLFGRLAKHDTNGAIDWGKNLPRLYTLFLRAFAVPVGTATADAPMFKSPSHRATLLFQLKGSQEMLSIAKCMIYILRNMADEGPGLRCMEKFVSLLEQYCHPSNNGRWTGDLASFLNYLVKYFLEQLAKQGREGLTEPRHTISKQTEKSILRCLLLMASRGQYSKEEDMRLKASLAMCNLAYVDPERVLPLVHKRFEEAMESLTATHQLSASIHGLGICVRPMLLAGLHLDGGFDAREAATESIAAAMMEVLPGLDANDQTKTGAVLRFYAAVMFSIPSLEPLSGPAAGRLVLPLDVELWAEEVLSRIFALLENMEAPEHRTDQSHTAAKAAVKPTFLMHEYAFFEAFVDQLLLKLPDDLRRHVVKRISGFLLTSCLPSVIKEAGNMCCSASEIDPEATIQFLVKPLIEKILEELPPVSGGSLNKNNFSHSLETTLLWHLSLLHAAIATLGKFIASNSESVMEVVDRALAVTSKEIQGAGMDILENALSALTNLYPVLEIQAFRTNILPCGAQSWVAKDPEDWSPPRWHTPSAAELNTAEKFVEYYLESGINELHDLASEMVQDSSGDFKDRVTQSLCKVRAVLFGAKESLVDFAIPEVVQKPPGCFGKVVPLRVAGASGITIGAPGLRERAAEALCQICPHLGDQDPIVSSLLVEAIDGVLCLGGSPAPDEYSDILNDGQDTADTLFLEPPVAAPLLQAGVNWHKRKPLYRTLFRLCDQYGKRSSDAMYQMWYSTANPIILDPALVPKSFGQLFGEVVRFSLHRYEVVRQGALCIVERAFVRFPALVDIYQPVYLLAIARSPIPQDLSLKALHGNPTFHEDTHKQLMAFMSPLDVDSIPSVAGQVTESTAEEMEQDAIVAGAVSVMAVSVAWRGIFRNPKKLAMAVYALMGSRQNKSSGSQMSASIFIWQFLLRFLGVPAGHGGAIDAEILECQRKLMQLGKEGVLLNWKYSLLANILLLASLPNRSDAAIVACVEHFLQAMNSKLPSLRQVCMVGLYSTLRPLITSGVVNQSVIQKVREYISKPGFGDSFLHNLIHGHVTHQADDDSKKYQKHIQYRIKEGSFEERLVRNAHVLLDRFGKWPETDNPSATLDGSFDLPQARVVQAFMSLAPSEMLSAVRQPVQALVEALGKHEAEKNEQSALAEILGGILASGVPWCTTSSGCKPWDEWVKDALRATLEAAPLENSSVYVLAVRFGVRGLLDLVSESNGGSCLGGGDSAMPAVKALLGAICIPFDISGAGQSAAEIKRLSNLCGALKELMMVFPLERLPAQLVPIFAGILEQLPQLMNIELQSVRDHVARLMVLVCGFLLEDKQLPVENSLKEVQQKAQGVCDLLVRRFAEGVEVIKSTAAGGVPESDGGKSADPMEVEGAGAEEGSSESHAAAHVGLDAKVGMAAEFVTAGMRFCQSPSLQHVLLRLLSGLFQVQELTTPSLKPLQLEASTAFALLKYLPVSVRHVQDVVDSILESPKMDQWSARAAGLVYLQVFWFRHCFLLSPKQSSSLEDMVVSRLSDTKLEVQTMASNTLAGILKGMEPMQEQALRSQFVSQIRRFYPNGRRAKKAKDCATVQEKHACILGLRGFVICHPYDIPSEWMPELLTLVVPAAGDPPPIRTTVTKMLGDFRRTHENESREDLRAAFDDEQWEALMGVGAQASYFT